MICVREVATEVKAMMKGDSSMMELATKIKNLTRELSTEMKFAMMT